MRKEGRDEGSGRKQIFTASVILADTVTAYQAKGPFLTESCMFTMKSSVLFADGLFHVLARPDLKYFGWRTESDMLCP